MNKQTKVVEVSELITKLKQREREERRRKRQLRKFKALSLDDKLKVIMKYNDEHGTNISYGKFIAGVENGSIKV